MFASFASWCIRLWLRVTGRKVSVTDHPWLDGPQGGAGYIGEDFFAEYARANGYETSQPAGAGLITDFSKLSLDPQPQLNPRVSHFYEHTSDYSLDVWSEWYYPWKPFAWMLIRFISHEINQLNIPLRPLDTSMGMTNNVILLKKPGASEQALACWLRKTKLKNKVVYSGFYAHKTIDGKPMVRVVFPLPKGNVTVLLHAEYLPDGSFRLVSKGNKFGQSGYYRVLGMGDGKVKVRLLPLHEVIHVFESPDGELRTDHEFRFWGLRMLKLHYRMREKQ